MIRSTLAKLAAVWLVLLTLSPLTAPFPTCDLGAMLDRSHHHHRPGRADSSPTTQADTAAAPLVSRAAIARGVRLVASSPYVSLKFGAAPFSGMSASYTADLDTALPAASSTHLRI